MRLCVVITFGFLAQASAQQSLEVASVKAFDPSAGRSGFRLSPDGRLTATGVTLEQMIVEAYGVKRYQMSGGPAWLGDSRFVISAKAEGDPPRGQMMKMLQALLEERFKLKLHRESKEGTVYNLVIAKGGPKLEPPKRADAPPRISTYFDGAPDSKTSYIYKGENATITMLAAHLAGVLEHPVFDHTGIAGQFDFRLEFEPDGANMDNSPFIFSALEKQVGVKLESAKGPVETLVIDHAEKPTGN
jgi:uncharacterized protein (TIGR03435 family)